MRKATAIVVAIMTAIASGCSSDTPSLPSAPREPVLDEGVGMIGGGRSDGIGMIGGGFSGDEGAASDSASMATASR